MFNVNGFLFEDEATAELARKEVERILFFREHMDLNNPEVVFKLYKKILKDEYFVTPVGIRFLVELQNALFSYEQIPREEIPGIPVVAIALKTKENMPEAEVDGETIVAGEADEHAQSQDEKTEHAGAADETSVAEGDGVSKDDSSEVKKENAKNTKAKEKASKAAKNRNAVKKTSRKDDGYKKPFYVALFFAIVFAVSVAGMFVITELSENNVNILNYRNEILNEYSTWEAQLKEKEAELAEWEEELEKRE